MKLENILENKERLYLLAVKYYYKIDEDFLNNTDKVINKSISILIDHEFIPTPCIEISLEIYHKDNHSSNYFVYFDEKKEFIDEFFISR
jgi:hypothetical protein